MKAERSICLKVVLANLDNKDNGVAGGLGIIGVPRSIVTRISTAISNKMFECGPEKHRWPPHKETSLRGLLGMTEADLEKFHEIGPARSSIVNDKLDEFGLRLGMSNEEIDAWLAQHRN